MCNLNTNLSLLKMGYDDLKKSLKELTPYTQGRKIPTALPIIVV